LRSTSCWTPSKTSCRPNSPYSLGHGYLCCVFYIKFMECAFYFSFARLFLIVRKYDSSIFDFLFVTFHKFLFSLSFLFFNNFLRGICFLCQCKFGYRRWFGCAITPHILFLLLHNIQIKFLHFSNTFLLFNFTTTSLLFATYWNRFKQLYLICYNLIWWRFKLLLLRFS